MSFKIYIKIAVIIASTAIGVKLSNLAFDFISKKNNEIHLKFLKSIASAIIVIVGISTLGLQFVVTADLSKTLLQSTSLLVAVIGFAAQAVLADVISGMMISWCKPFNIGERITLLNYNITGTVEDITLRHTVIRGFDNNRIIIPNSQINKELIKNSNYSDSVIGNFIEISVGYSSDIRKAMAIMEKLIADHPLVIDTRKDKSQGSKVVVSVKELASSGIILKTTVWTKDVDDNFTACSELRLQIKEEFDRQNIEIPYNYLHIVGDSNIEQPKIEIIR